MEEFDGYWWLPSNKENKIGGKLKVYNDRHSELIVVGSSKDIESVFPPIKEFGDIFHIPKFDLIVGYVKSVENKDVSITLQTCDILRTETSGLMKVTFQIENVIKELAFNTEEQIRINSLFVKYDFLGEWAMKTGFHVAKQDSNEKFTAKIEYEHPEQITLLKNDKYHIVIWFRANIPWLHHFGSMYLKEEIYINFEFFEKVPLAEAKVLAQKVQDLFSFMVASQVGRQNVEFRIYSNGEAQEANFVNPTCQLIYPELINRTKRKIYQNEMMITLKSLQSKEHSIFEKWLENYDKIAQVKRLYFDTFYNNYMSDETRFLNLTMALEIYHFRIINSVRGKSKPTLNKRITELISNHAHITNHFDDDLENFVKMIVHTRNYYNHGGGEGSELLIPTNKLLDFNIKMRILLEVIILNDLGFSDEEIYFKISNVYQFSLIVDFP